MPKIKIEKKVRQQAPIYVLKEADIKQEKYAMKEITLTEKQYNNLIEEIIENIEHRIIKISKAQTQLYPERTVDFIESTSLPLLCDSEMLIEIIKGLQKFMRQINKENNV